MSPLVFPGEEPRPRPYQYIPDFISGPEADAYIKKIEDETPWALADLYERKGSGCGWINQENLPKRRSAWAGPCIVLGKSAGKRCFAGLPISWAEVPTVLEIKARVEKALGQEFNSCLINLYADGDCGIGKHRDQDDESDWSRPIASVSLGAERLFNIYDGKNQGLVSSETLAHGSLCVMPPGFQEKYLHEIPHEEHIFESRVNLTFRFVDVNKYKPQEQKMMKYKSHDDAYKPPQKTIGGYNGYQVISALQKCIRRGLEQDALFWATELWDSCIQSGREYVWHRLRVIASEDVGLADNNACVQVSALYSNFTRRPNEKIFLWHAVLLLARAPKSRIVDHAGIAISEGPRPKREIPSFAIDNHAGGKMNWRESFRLENCALPDPYEAQAKTIKEAK